MTVNEKVADVEAAARRIFETHDLPKLVKLAVVEKEIRELQRTREELLAEVRPRWSDSRLAELGIGEGGTPARRRPRRSGSGSRSRTASNSSTAEEPGPDPGKADAGTEPKISPASTEPDGSAWSTAAS